MPEFTAKPQPGTPINRANKLAGGLVGAWLLGERSGTKAYDSVKGQTGTLNNFALTGSSSNWITGRHGRQLNFDGTNDAVPISASPATLLQPIGPITVAALVSWTSTTTGMSALGFGSTSGNNPLIILGSSTTSSGTMGRVIWRNDGLQTVDINATTAINNGEPHLLVATLNGNATSVAVTVSLYVDGRLAGTGTTTPGTQTINTLTIGALTRASVGSFWNGNVSMAGVWNRALQPSEIQALWADPFTVWRRRYVPAIFPVSAGGGSDGVGTSAGTATASGVGSSAAASAGSSAGVGAAVGVGSATVASVGSSAGAATASATGSATTAGVGSSAGTGAAAAVGSSTAAAVASSAGVATVAGVGSSASSGSGAGSSSGVATASGVGRSAASAVGSSAGIATAAGVGSSVSSGSAVASSAGVATASAVGASAVAAIFSAIGTATAQAYSPSSAITPPITNDRFDFKYTISDSVEFNRTVNDVIDF